MPSNEEGIALLAELWTQPDPGFGILRPDAWATFATWMVAQDLLPAGFSAEGAIGANLPAPSLATPGQ